MRMLLVEDDTIDADLVRRAFAKVADSFSIEWVRDGQEALDYLAQSGAYADVARPDLILMDLQMPRINGYDLLRAVKDGDPAKRRIPVVVLSSSEAARDIKAAYELGCASFFCKGQTFEELEKIASSINDYWANSVRLP